MGLHTKSKGTDVIDFIYNLGSLLDYYVVKEEPMFTNDKNSPIFDITWRFVSSSITPFFVFEVESSLTKSSTDNAVKLFSKKTATYTKPPHFFHIYVGKTKPSTFSTLKEMFDNVNYSLIKFDRNKDFFLFITSIIEKHLQITPNLNIYKLIELLLDKFSKEELHRFLFWYVDKGYDKQTDLKFVYSLEKLILHYPNSSISEYYLKYLPHYLGYPDKCHNYTYLTPNGYSEIIHRGINILFNSHGDYSLYFEELNNIASSYTPFDLWFPHFRSRDHAIVLLFEFPIILTLLTLAFSSTNYCKEFTKIHRNLLFSYGVLDNLSTGSFIWLLISSQISNSIDEYTFAKNMLNSVGGISLELLNKPITMFSEDMDQRFNLKADFIIPDFIEWCNCLKDYLMNEKVELLESIIDSLLVMESPEEGRKKFFKYSLLFPLFNNN